MKNDTQKRNMAKKTIPENLYRYRSINTAMQLINVINEVRKGDIYLSRPLDFNDIYDATSILSKDNWYDYFKDSHKLPFLIEIFKHVNKEYSETSPSDVIEQLKNMKMDFWIELNKHCNETLRKMRIACFTECFDSMPMWAHYASDHQGVCLLYDTTSVADSLDKTRLFPVKYSKQIPDIIYFINNRKRRKNLIESCATRKHADWSYEKEWRLVYHQEHLHIINQNDLPYNYDDKGVTINFCKPSKMFIGHKVSARVEQFLRDVIGSLGIDVVKMEVTPYGLVEKK